MKNIRRILLKLSGEALQGNASFGPSLDALEYMAKEIMPLKKDGVQVCLVVGGGNLIRGKQFTLGKFIRRATADYMGMLGTVMNALALQDALISHNAQVAIFSAIPMHTVCEPYSRNRALEALGYGKIVIFAGGIGNPYVTTDTVSVIKSLEMDCDILLKGTQVNGVYDSDPKKNKSAKRYKNINYDEVISKNLAVMDLGAIHIAREHKLPIAVFDIHKKGNLLRVVKNGLTKIENFSLIS